MATTGMCRSSISMIKSFFHRPIRLPPSAPPPEIERAALLEEVRIGLRVGLNDQAQEMLESFVASSQPPDAACLNLLGVVHERRGQWKLARKFYGRAMRADRRYLPAQRNMRRIYELYTLGQCSEGIVLGDEKPALMLLLRQRDLVRAQANAKASPMSSS